MPNLRFNCSSFSLSFKSYLKKNKKGNLIRSINLKIINSSNNKSNSIHSFNISLHQSTFCFFCIKKNPFFFLSSLPSSSEIHFFFFFFYYIGALFSLLLCYRFIHHTHLSTKFLHASSI